MTSFVHDMRFGANLLPDGTVRFRLWAPGLDRVSLVIDQDQAAMAMEPHGDGWFEVTTDAARAGSLYAFQLSDGLRIPDPASRQQAEDVHGPSVVVDPLSYPWRYPDWRGRPWHEVVLYELHTGTFTDSGDFEGIQHKLDWLADLGVTAIELMPLADFSGRRNWGYDGVLPFAPARSYGTPDQLKALIDAAHERGLMMFLDVVYNHFGPDGNYLGRYAPQFFTDRHHTPWGAAIDFAQPVVREFFIQNALYWLNEFRFDGLRLDAVHAILDDSPTHILTELANRVRETSDPDRHVHLVLENDANQSHFLQQSPKLQYNAQWNDDFHHASHVVLTRESEGYYADYQRDPLAALGLALAQGFVYQGESSIHRDNAPRGEPTLDLPLSAFVAFLQNHDQVGNRAFGERLAQLVRPELLRAAASILILSPQIPLLFMGEEWASARPFQFFCDFRGELAQAVRDGRRREFMKFPAFAEPAVRDRIPDPNDIATFRRSKLDWSEVDRNAHTEHLQYCRELLAVRRAAIIPRLAQAEVRDATYDTSDGLLRVSWLLADNARLTLIANLHADTSNPMPAPLGRMLHSTHPHVADSAAKPGWFVAWYLADRGAAT
ncbi:malto-oligosyltrehalose trehalohydrolase [Dongia deserti]|uniref:malto-oligosyltrehalose trehalohydrolase n=1 Tax=Dongia deserti TaxID=2268030 RepID=UPI002548E967|nr:malto-oligosyltrehalose trehalohydrolase [Dongia deserti]